MARINKAAATVAAPEATHELTGMSIQEVSAVDRAANRRKFLVTKNETPEETAARVQAKIAERGDAAPGAVAKDDLGTSDLPTPVPGSPEAHAAAASAHAHAASAHANAAAGKKKTEKGADVVPLPEAGVSAPAVVAAPAAVASTVDPVAEMEALAKAENDKAEAAKVATVPTTKATDVVVTPNPDGSVTIAVDDQPVVLTPSLPGAVADKVKTSVVAGIDAVMLRIATLRQSVVESKSSYSDGTPSELGDIYYITEMLYSLYNIGGPRWEVQQAADAALDRTEASADVAKAAGVEVPVRKNKVITMARVMKLQAAHKAMKYSHDDMAKVLKELDSEGGDATGEMSSDSQATNGTPATNFAKAETAPVVATPPAPAVVTEKDIESDPRFVAMKNALTKTQTDLANVQQIATQQAATLAKARGSIATSNVSVDKVANVREASSDAVEWPRDLAADTTKLNKRF